MDTREVVGTYSVNGDRKELAVIRYTSNGRVFYKADDGMSHRDYATRAAAVRHLKRTHADLGCGIAVTWSE